MDKNNGYTQNVSQFIIDTVIYENSNGRAITQNKLKEKLKIFYDIAPQYFGRSKTTDGPASWDSVYGSYRSSLSAVFNDSNGSGVFKGKILLIQEPGTGKDTSKRYLFDIANYSLFKNFISIKPSDIYRDVDEENIITKHSEVQYQLCSIAQKLGYYVYLDPKDVNKVSSQFEEPEKFNEILVKKFKGYDNINKYIDCIFLEKIDDKFVPIISFEVEDSTGVTDGIRRLKRVPGIKIVCSNKDKYKKKFEENEDTKGKEWNFKYYNEIKREFDYLHSDSVNTNEDRIKENFLFFMKYRS
jgi:hypothetical protein